MLEKSRAYKDLEIRQDQSRTCPQILQRGGSLRTFTRRNKSVIQRSNWADSAGGFVALHGDE